MCQIKRKADEETDNLVLFLCGDVMTGRGIDQILLYPSKPKLHESYMTNAMGNVALAEDVSGIIPRRVAPAYIWGDALTEFERIQPDLKIINLETAITKNDDYLPDKEIHYRMHPYNILCIAAAGINCCVLANNHVLDWGVAGFEETLAVLHKQNIAVVGAGRNDKEARPPVIFDVARKGHVKQSIDHIAANNE